MTATTGLGTLLAASARLLPLAIDAVLKERPNLVIKVVEGTNEVLMPGLRVGFLVAEGPIYDSLVSYKRVNDLATSNLIQRALEAEYYFFSKIFAFTPADAVEPVQIENL